MAKINQSGIDKLFQEIAGKIERLDTELRANYAGKPVDEILDPITQAVTRLGIQTNSQDLRDYADAVSKRLPFSINLQ